MFSTPSGSVLETPGPKRPRSLYEEFNQEQQWRLDKETAIIFEIEALAKAPTVDADKIIEKLKTVTPSSLIIYYGAETGTLPPGPLVRLMKVAFPQEQIADAIRSAIAKRNRVDTPVQPQPAPRQQSERIESTLAKDIDKLDDFDSAAFPSVESWLSDQLLRVAPADAANPERKALVQYEILRRKLINPLKATELLKSYDPSKVDDLINKCQQEFGDRSGVNRLQADRTGSAG